MKQKLSIAMSLAVILAMLLTSLALADSDTTPPVITPDVQGIPSDAYGWYISPVYVTWSAVDDESPITSSSGCDPTWIDADTLGTTLTCTATSEGGTSSESVTIRIDRTPPTIYGTTSPAPNEYGWNKTDATATFTCDDWGSGVMYCEGDWFYNYEGAGLTQGNARAVDYSWNDERLPYGISIDKTAPTVALVGGPVDGVSYYFGFVPTAPTCSASDALSGLVGSCSVSGYSTAIGLHTVIASATDKAGNSTSASATYTVSALAEPDTQPPVITPNVVGWMGENGWWRSPVIISWSVVDNESPITSTSGCDETTMYADTPGTTLTCTATSAGGTSSEAVTIGIDMGSPDIYGFASPAPNEYGWNNTDVTIWFECYDYASGVMYCEPEYTFTEEGYHSVYARAVDYAWNDWRLGMGANIDKTAPTVALVGGPVDGVSYHFGFVPTAPTCSASDALSGLVGSCSVSGYSTAIGLHTVTASATDKAGNSASASATYTVRAWSLKGFYAPVDMNGVYNVVRGGNTVQLKFEVFAGPKELSDTSVVKSFTAASVACPAGAGATIGQTASAPGGTALRYDSAAGLFIQTWQTPRQAGACYRVTVMTQDGSSLVAFFKLK